MPRIIESIHYS